MIDDFTPIVHRLRGRPVKIWAVADVHIGARECDLDGFSAFLKRIESDPDSYLVIVGDVLNNGTSDPQALLLGWTGSNNKDGSIQVIW